MKQAAIAHANARLAKARRALSEMNEAKSLDDAALAWSDFLIAASGVYSKLEQGAKGGGKSEGWFGRKKHERKADPLLQYVHQARNADEHGIEPITKAEPAGFSIGGRGSYRLDGSYGSEAGLRITHIDGPPPIVLIGRKLRLTTVRDSRHGDTFDPPTAHLGVAIADPSPIGVAILALSYLEGLLTEAAQLAE